MFRRDAFVLIAAALVVSAMAVYASLGETPFFPASFQTTLGDCPENGDIPAHRRAILDEDEATWFRHQLMVLHEAPLFPVNASQSPTLRFTYLADGQVAMVRVTEAEGGRLLLTGKWLFGSAGCADRGGCVVKKLLSPAEQSRLEAAAEPLLRVPSHGCYGHVDGSIFVLEETDGHAYRMWHQWSPRDGDLRRTGEILLQFAGWSPVDW
jgi:hypothetical protein